MTKEKKEKLVKDYVREAELLTNIRLAKIKVVESQEELEKAEQELLEFYGYETTI